MIFFIVLTQDIASAAIFFATAPLLVFYDPNRQQGRS